ncbi:unnamed protein product [Urochloa humidicola]
MASESSMDVDGGSSTARAAAGAGAQQPQWPSWRPRLVAYASSSSTSGSLSLSTTYTSGSSHLLSSSSSGGDGCLAPTVALLSTQLQLQEEMQEKMMLRHFRGLVQEFSYAFGDDQATAPVLERWLSDLGISWVLSITTTKGNSSARAFIFPHSLGDLARSWIDALTVTQLSISACLDTSRNQDQGAFPSVITASEFGLFLESTLLKMLPFADAVMSWKVTGPSIQHNNLSTDSGEQGAVPAEKKLRVLLDVRDAISAASENVPHQSVSLLSGKMTKLDDATRDTLDEVRTSITSMVDNHNAADSPDIHRATRSIVSCIKVVLSSDYGSRVARLGVHVTQDNIFDRLLRNADPLPTLIREMLSSLQENLARVSQSFSDQSLRFLFLLNNTHFMWQQLRHDSHGLGLYMVALSSKIYGHVQRYLQASWIPVVSGLHDPTPLCLGRYSPLAKFESEFHKTYTAQKLWKVPDPELRRRLRKAIIETVIPAFTKYLEDNKITAPRVTQQELEDMLQDLFEG